jgi:hypothetical protein
MVVCVALAFLYGGLCLHEDEEGHIQDRIQTIWIRVAYLRDDAMSRNAAFLKATAETALNILNRVFGHSLLSFQSIATCMVFSAMSYYIATFWAMAQWRSTGHPAQYLLRESFFMVANIGLATYWILGSLGDDEERNFYWRYGRFCVVVIAEIGYINSLRASTISLRGKFLCVVGSIVMDLIFVAFLRGLLRRVVNSVNFVVMAFGMLMSILIGTVTSLALAYTIIAGMHCICEGPLLKMGPLPIFSFAREHYSALVSILGTNILDALCSFMVFCVLVFALANRIIWPLAERVIYAAHRRKFFTNPKLLCGCGVVALLLCVPASWEPVRTVMHYFLA